MWRLLILLAALHSVCANPISACDKLGTVIMHEITTFVREALLEAAELLQRVIDEAELLGPSDTDRCAMQRIGKFIESTKQIEDSEELMDFLEEMVELLSLDDDSMEVENALLVDPDDLVGKLLRQFGFNSFEQKIERKLESFLKTAEYHIESYLMKLKDYKNSGMPTWFIAFQKETNVESKLDLFDELLEYIDC